MRLRAVGPHPSRGGEVEPRRVPIAHDGGATSPANATTGTSGVSHHPGATGDANARVWESATAARYANTAGFSLRCEKLGPWPEGAPEEDPCDEMERPRTGSRVPWSSPSSRSWLPQHRPSTSPRDRHETLAGKWAGSPRAGRPTGFRRDDDSRGRHVRVRRPDDGRYRGTGKITLRDSQLTLGPIPGVSSLAAAAGRKFLKIQGVSLPPERAEQRLAISGQPASARALRVARRGDRAGHWGGKGKLERAGPAPACRSDSVRATALSTSPTRGPRQRAPRFGTPATTTTKPMTA